jgi:hypothetical protein
LHFPASLVAMIWSMGCEKKWSVQLLNCALPPSHFHWLVHRHHVQTDMGCALGITEHLAGRNLGPDASGSPHKP